jgi:hypothetical protein
MVFDATIKIAYKPSIAGSQDETAFVMEAMEE